MNTLSDCIAVGNSANICLPGVVHVLRRLLGHEFDEVIGLDWMLQDQNK